jgi:hypothetical protein
MLARKVIPFLVACFSVSPLIIADDFSKTVIPITELNFLGLGVEGKFGTGFCLDRECRFIGTNYHVAMMGQPGKIKGERVFRAYLATGPNDEGATVNDVPGLGPLSYTISRDIAIFELRRPLSQYHGIAFHLGDLQVGQDVDIYAYPKESINPIRTLMRFHGTFKGQTTSGLLAFDYSLSGDKAIQPGASGGIVVDSKTQQIVGILSELAKNRDAIALAVPVQSLVDLVSKVNPWLAQTIFQHPMEVSPISVDLYPRFVSGPTNASHFRQDESAEINVLRSKAQLLADSMRNFIAVQTFAWGAGDGAPAAESTYEVRVLDGYQHFREYPSGKKELQDPPLPSLTNAMSTGGEWAALPEMVGTALQLRIHQAADMIVNGQKIMVFQYQADQEDGVCKFNSILDFGFFVISRTSNIGCYGEVWTDTETNILRMSEHFELLGRWKDYQAVVTYGWLQRTDETPKLIPLTISAQAELKKTIYWCRGRFTNYRVFTTRVNITATQ